MSTPSPEADPGFFAREVLNTVVDLRSRGSGVHPPEGIGSYFLKYKNLRKCKTAIKHIAK